MEKELHKAYSMNLHFHCVDGHGWYEIQDLENSGQIIGYLGLDDKKEVTFYPRSGYAYAAEALAEINAKAQHLLNQSSTNP